MRSITTALTTSAAALIGVSFASAQDATVPAPGAVAADATAVETEIVPLSDWTPDISAETSMSVEELLEMDVHGPAGEEIGDVENVLLGLDGEVLSVIAEVGGVWDIGDTHVNVPWADVDVDPVAERIVLPVTQETVEEYTLFTDDVITAADAATDIQEVEGDSLGLTETGPRIWQARELINDYVRLQDGDSYINYGYVDDIIIQDGQIASVVVRPDTAFGARGLYAYPYYGYGYGWTPGAAYYDLPYARAEVESLEPFDDGIWDD